MLSSLQESWREILASFPKLHPGLLSGSLICPHGSNQTLPPPTVPGQEVHGGSVIVPFLLSVDSGAGPPGFKSWMGPLLALCPSAESQAPPHTY